MLDLFGKASQHRAQEHNIFVFPLQLFLELTDVVVCANKEVLRRKEGRREGLRGVRKGGKEGGREGRREGGREGRREGGREGGEGKREGRRGGREGGKGDIYL